MSDDLKQKETEAWRDVARYAHLELKDATHLRPAVSASIAAALAEALAPALERVARLEERGAIGVAPAIRELVEQLGPTLAGDEGTINNQPYLKLRDLTHPEEKAMRDAYWSVPKPPAPCATCGGARFVCERSLADCKRVRDGVVHAGCGNVQHSGRRPCPDCSKPAASPEGETACTRHGQYRCPACAAGMVENAQNLSPAESEGSRQWRAGRSIGRTLYIGDKCIGMVDTPELAAAIVEAMSYPSRAEPEGSGLRIVCFRCNQVLADMGALVFGPPGGGMCQKFHVCRECWCALEAWLQQVKTSGVPVSRDLRNPVPVRGSDETGAISPAPAAPQGIPQSGPQAPERVWIRHGNSSGLEWALIWNEFVGPLQKDHTEYVPASKLASAERRIAELEAVLLEAERKLADNPAIDAAVYAAVSRQARAEGREAGIREAATIATMWSIDGSHRNAILSLLAKKPEGT